MNDNLQPHIRFGASESAKYAILPGDPGRCDKVAKFLTDVKEVAYNREFRTISGYYKGVKILVTSTGIGGPSASIAVEELRNTGTEVLIRIGSCGALQPDIKLGELIIANGAVRKDGASATYIESSFPAVPDTKLLYALIKSAEEQGFNHRCGIIKSHDSFYTDCNDDIDNFWASKGVIGSDMESAALFVVSSLRGLRAASILNVVVEKTGDLKDGINEYVDGESEIIKGEEHEILTALEAIYSIDKEN